MSREVCPKANVLMAETAGTSPPPVTATSITAALRGPGLRSHCGRHSSGLLSAEGKLEILPAVLSLSNSSPASKLYDSGAEQTEFFNSF